MDDDADRLLAGRYRLPHLPADAYEPVESRAYDTAGGREVLVLRVPLPEVVEAGLPGAPGESGGAGGLPGPRGERPGHPHGPAVRRAAEAALAASRLPDHPRLGQVFDAFVEGDGLWIAGEPVAARPLAAVLAEGPLDPHRAAEVAADLLSALRAVHARGWAHRNVTPRTVLVCGDGRALLTGLAAGAAEEALCGYDPLPSPGTEPEAAPAGPRSTTGGTAAGAAPRRGPATVLAAERARQTRMVAVGAVTERWAPEQAAPVRGSQLPPPGAGPAADLWALGALLFRAVEGRAPYPEESAAELVRAVCSEPPAAAEGCGPLRPVVEALLRRDPAERPDPGELADRLRSLVHSAPEPEAGLRTVTALPGPGASASPRRLPAVRHRGEPVRLRRAEHPPAPARARYRQPGGGRRSPYRLGLLLVGLVLLAVAGALAYTAAFLPKAAPAGAGGPPAPAGAEPSSSAPRAPSDTSSGTRSGSPDGAPRPSTAGHRDRPGLPEGYTLHEDPAGFQLAVPEGWERHGHDGGRRVRFTGGGLELVVVPGRDTTEQYGADPVAYQLDLQPELAAYRAADWSTSSGVRRIDVGERTMAEGRFGWRGSSGEVYLRNRATILDGRYHLVMVRGPAGESAVIDRHFDLLADTYRAGG